MNERRLFVPDVDLRFVRWWNADGLRLQVDVGNEQTALIHEWQVVKE